jgi:diadenosine tetraphosphate (Ap4A) HIT family hydrolase
MHLWTTRRVAVSLVILMGGRSGIGVDTDFHPPSSSSSTPHAPPEDDAAIVSRGNTRRLATAARHPSTLSATTRLIPSTEASCQFHAPPRPLSNDYYDNNTTPFGAILRGELPAVVYAETNELLAFADIHPQAKLHALIIPKRLVTSVLDLTPSDLPLLHSLHDLGHSLLDQFGILPNRARMVFHVPPFNSVSHLHLHVLSEEGLTWKGRLKYWTETKWCTSWVSVVQRLERLSVVNQASKERPHGF